MIASIITILLAFVWLGYESDWMRVRLLVGQLAEQPKRKWQFLKYGDDALMMWRASPIGCVTECRECRKDDDVWFGWRIPARTVKIAGSTINFKAGCNLYRAKLLKDIVKAQKSKAVPTYKSGVGYGAQYYNCYEEESIELLVDGKSVASINGDYKRGMIKTALKPYTTKARMGHRAFIMPVGEADRVNKA